MTASIRPASSPARGSRARRLAACGVIVGGLLLGCSQASFNSAEARAEWLASTLVEDNLDLLLREPERTEGKFMRMAEDPYRFLRGTAGQFLRDLTEPGPGYLRSAFVGPESSMVLLVGDAHPENLGTARDDDGVTVTFNDFDAARFGPYHFDVRRLAVGFSTLVDVAAPEALSDDDRRALGERLARAVATGYAAEVVEVAAGREPLLVEYLRDAGTIADDLMRRALRDGRERAELQELTAIDGDGARRFSLPPPEARDPQDLEDDFVEPTSAQRALVTALLDEHREHLRLDDAFAQVKDLKVRLGSGVASFSLWRFYALIEGPSESVDDDVILELKEARDPFPIEELPLFPARSHAHNAARAVACQRALQRVSGDPFLDAVGDAAASFKVREVAGDQKGLRVNRVAEKLAQAEWTDDNLDALARLGGRILAVTHASGPRLDGGDAGSSIAAEIEGREEAFADEVATFAALYRGRILDDYALFRQLIEERGPRLGFVP